MRRSGAWGSQGVGQSWRPEDTRAEPVVGGRFSPHPQQRAGLDCLFVCSLLGPLNETACVNSKG